MIEPFLCRVSSAGVPHTIVHSRASEYTISGLSALDMCKLYWTLRRINVRYTFAINGVSLSRMVTIETTVSPKNRLIRPVEFYQTGYDSAYDTSYLCRLGFDPIYLVNDDTLGLRLLISEIDSTGAINFNTIPVVGMANVSYNSRFLDIPFKMYLNYNPNVVSSASIMEFSSELEFFD
ncbi:MAG: hypothetical protein K2L13_01500 [Opitutales bacterium]|nr:hypothetical protein [Opitutales bacterium]